MGFSGGNSTGSISGANDAAVSNPADGQVLTYNATVQKWQNQALSSANTTDATTTSKGVVKLAGDLGGTAASPAVLSLKGVMISNAPSGSGQVLVTSSTSTASWTVQSSSGSTIDGGTP